MLPFQPGHILGSSRAPAPVSPASIFGADLLAWYTADTGVFSDAGTTPAVNTNGVERWNDQSGHGYHLSVAFASEPQYLSAGFNGLPTVQFAAAGSILRTTADSVAIGATAAHSWFAVGQMVSPLTYGRLAVYFGNAKTIDFDNAQSACPLLRISLSNFFAAYSNNLERATKEIVPSTNYRFGSVFDGAFNTVYVNNVAGTSIATTDALSSPGTIMIGAGALTAAPESFWDGPVSEIVVVKRGVTSDERLALDNYFKSKWGL